MKLSPDDLGTFNLKGTLLLEKKNKGKGKEDG